jgi:hypothetical protein
MAPPPLLRRASAILARVHLRPRPLPTSAPLSSKTNFDPVVSSDEATDDLRSRLLRLRFPKRSATVALQNWVSEGREAPPGYLRDAVRELSRCGQYKHALEVRTNFASAYIILFLFPVHRQFYQLLLSLLFSIWPDYTSINHLLLY